jgi:hypothetical protein
MMHDKGGTLATPVFASLAVHKAKVSDILTSWEITPWLGISAFKPSFSDSSS